MSNELANMSPGAIMQVEPTQRQLIVQDQIEMLQAHVQTLEMCRQLGSHYAHTAMVPKAYQGKPEDAAVAIQWGMEIGLQPLQSLQNIACINGTPSLWGDSLIALVKTSGVCEYISTDWDPETQTATVSTKRRGEPEESRSYSWTDAERAGLTGRDTYKRHPQRMITARARSHVLRDVYADLLKGFQVREIAEEDQKSREKDITDAAHQPKTKQIAADPAAAWNSVKQTQQQKPQPTFHAEPDETAQVQQSEPEPSADDQAKKISDYAERAAKRWAELQQSGDMGGAAKLKVEAHRKLEAYPEQLAAFDTQRERFIKEDIE